MVIRASSRTQIDGLIAGLSAESAMARDTAITRLTVIGARALERVMTLVDDRAAAPAARAAALRVLEAMGHARSLDVVLRAMNDEHNTVAAAAVGAARAFLRGVRCAAAVDQLTTMALNRERDEALRITALRALSELGPSTLKPLYAALASDPNPSISAIAAHPDKEPQPVSAASWLKAAADGELPDDPAALRRAIASEGGAVPLTALHRIIERLRERERSEPGRCIDWMTVRGAAHAALADRGSRLALYDLRETLEAASAPLPVDFLSALNRIGGVSCLEAIAPAYARANDEWWRSQLADAFRVIAARERITGRHAAMKRIGKRWPAILGTEAGKAGRPGKPGSAGKARG